MCNYRDPGLRRVWEVGSEQQFLTPLRSPGGRRDEFPKRPRCCYTRHFRAREVRESFRAMRRLRSWLGSRGSRARESIAKSTFDRKTHMIWKTFFRVFAGWSPTPYIYNELSTSRRHSFHNFASQLANSTSGPRTAQRRPREVPGEPGKGLEGLSETSRETYII